MTTRTEPAGDQRDRGDDHHRDRDEAAQLRRKLAITRALAMDLTAWIERHKRPQDVGLSGAGPGQVDHKMLRIEGE